MNRLSLSQTLSWDKLGYEHIHTQHIHTQIEKGQFFGIQTSFFLWCSSQSRLMCLASLFMLVTFACFSSLLLISSCLFFSLDRHSRHFSLFSNDSHLAKVRLRVFFSAAPCFITSWCVCSLMAQLFFSFWCVQPCSWIDFYLLLH